MLTTCSKCFPKLVNVSPFLKPAAASSQLQGQFAGPQAGVHIVILPWQNLVWRRNHGRLVLRVCVTAGSSSLSPTSYSMSENSSRESFDFTSSLAPPRRVLPPTSTCCSTFGPSCLCPSLLELSTCCRLPCRSLCRRSLFSSTCSLIATQLSSGSTRVVPSAGRSSMWAARPQL